MTRVKIIVEGLTEQSFVRDVLAPTLWSRQVFLYPILLGHSGGNPSYTRVKTDVLAQLKQDRTAYCSTLLDFYGLGEGFPGTPLPPALANIEKVIRIEQAAKEDIVEHAPDLRAEFRFLPYLQLHEYEGLLFSDPAAFAKGIDQPNLAEPFQLIRNQFKTPEDIDDDPDTAPSKRVLELHPSYSKIVDGTLGAKAVGIEIMRQQCPHFHGWVERLESLGVAK